MTTLYWIHHKIHTDITTEGYVGITKNFEERMRQHQKKSSKSKRLLYAIEKYKEDIVYDIVESFDTRESAQKREFELRPDIKIGWNMVPGGDVPPSIKGRKDIHKKISRTLKQKGITPYCENTHSQEAVEKRKQTIREKKQRWYHDPETLEYRIISTSTENIPNGWQPGRKPKSSNKIRGVDYFCNAQQWKLYENGALIWEGINLREFVSEYLSLSVYPNLTKGTQDKPYKNRKTGNHYYATKK